MRATVVSSPTEKRVAMPTTKLLINGQWVESVSGKRFATINPATGEAICDMHCQRQAENRNCCASWADLVREYYWDVQVASDLGRDCGCHGPYVTEKTVPAAAIVARKFGPRGRHDRHVDSAAIVIPDAAVHHIGADRQSDPAPGCEDNERRPPSPESKCLPEDQVSLPINVD